MRLNLGCGDRYVPGWTNVDSPDCPHHVDEPVDLTGSLPDRWAGQVTHIYAGHLFEHITSEAGARLAARLLDCADPTGCLLWLVGPDMQVATAMADAGTLDTTWHTLDSIVHGAGRWAGDVHVSWTTGESIAGMLSDAGWPVVADLGGVHALAGLAEGAAWPVADRTPPWQYAVRAWAGATDAPWERAPENA